MEDLNKATFVGIDAHTREHTALAITRFEEEKGNLAFENSEDGIAKFLCWLKRIDSTGNIVVGVEGGGWERTTLLRRLVGSYNHIYDINPLFTKQRRDLGTKGDKSDIVDARLIAEVLAKKMDKLPKIIPEALDTSNIVLKKLVWYYEEITEHGARVKNQLGPLVRTRVLALEKEEKQSLDLIIRLKKAELKKIQSLQSQLKPKLSSLIAKSGYGNLTTITGVSTVLAAKILAHTGGIERFQKVDKYVKYAGIAPVERSSGKTRRFIKGNRGNRRLHATFYLVALSQIRWDKKAKGYFEKKVSEGKTKKHALRCLIKRIACITYGMLKSKEGYRR